MGTEIGAVWAHVFCFARLSFLVQAPTVVTLTLCCAQKRIGKFIRQVVTEDPLNPAFQYPPSTDSDDSTDSTDKLHRINFHTCHDLLRRKRNKSVFYS